VLLATCIIGFLVGILGGINVHITAGGVLFLLMVILAGVGYCYYRVVMRHDK